MADSSIRNYLGGGIGSEVAVSSLAKPIEEAYSAGKTEGDDGTETQLWDLWSSFLQRARGSDDEAQDKLVILLAALKARTNPQKPKDKPDLKGNWVWSEGDLWSDLVVFGASAREEYNEQPSPPQTQGGKTNPSDDDSNLSGQIQSWARLNAFLARVTAAKVDSFALYSIWALRGALEDETASAEELDISVPAAAAWIEHDGKGIYTNQKKWEDNNPGGGNPARGGKLWEGPSGFDSERWNLWKKRFGQIAKEENRAAEGTRKLAEKAVKRMEEIEKSS